VGKVKQGGVSEISWQLNINHGILIFDFSTKVSSQPKLRDLMQTQVSSLSHLTSVEKRLNEKACVFIKISGFG
jgi:hypothetical protein